ncbi:MAG TPA: hypothetical protein PLP21_03405 [Pyrinomonadaceae bacterium]|nr:hypothetical protein [Acidobacteriota bacterium]HQZ95336.1 hypothetical protein [Pyrinomonadaceae bacterium]
MAILKAVRADERVADEPVNIGDRAIDNLQFIRETMERSTHFTAVPGYGGMLMGVTALVAAYIANTQVLLRDSLVTWLIEGALAFAIGMLAMWQKSKIGGQSLVSAPARKFALGFAPPLIVGVIVVLGLAKNGYFYVMAPICMLSYGAAVVCGGAFSVRVIPVMGWFFMALGAIAFAIPAHYGNMMMGASFGMLHIIFGAIIAKKYGG